MPKTETIKRKRISSNIKENNVILSDKELTVDSLLEEKKNKQNLSDELSINEMSEKLSEINVTKYYYFKKED